MYTQCQKVGFTVSNNEESAQKVCTIYLPWHICIQHDKNLHQIRWIPYKPDADKMCYHKKGEFHQKWEKISVANSDSLSKNLNWDFQNDPVGQSNFLWKNPNLESDE